jgi:hypothetical protein
MKTKIGSHARNNELRTAKLSMELHPEGRAPFPHNKVKKKNKQSH